MWDPHFGSFDLSDTKGIKGKGRIWQYAASEWEIPLSLASATLILYALVAVEKPDNLFCHKSSFVVYLFFCFDELPGKKAKFRKFEYLNSYAKAV